MPLLQGWNLLGRGVYKYVAATPLRSLAGLGKVRCSDRAQASRGQ